LQKKNRHRPAEKGRERLAWRALHVCGTGLSFWREIAKRLRQGPGTLAQSFSPFLARDGQQVCRPSWIWATSLCYILLNKFVALVGSGRRTCRPSCDEKGLKDWAIAI
jgi:hypothetical protein